MSILKSTGDPDIDKTHQKLVNMMLDIVKSSDNGVTIFDIKQKLDSLYHVANLHFKEEENLMHDIEYPFKSTHIMAHEDILSKIRMFKEIIEHTKKEYNLFAKSLLKIIASHVENYDVSLFEFVSLKLELSVWTGEGATSSLPS